MAQLPGGEEWLAVIEGAPDGERHLAVHDQHMVGLNPADQAAWDAGADTMVEAFSFTGSAATIRARATELADRGVTEIVYQPAGPGIRRELETFIAAVRA
jgi:5,10-methylenetetrahydromethanopterin reductase